MRVRNICLLAFIVVLSSTSLVRAQGNVADPDPLAKLKKQVDELTGVVGDLAMNVMSVSDSVKSNTDLIGELNVRVTELEEEVRKKDDELKEILDAISRRDSTGKPILALNNIMQESEEFRSELHDAVNSSIDDVGKLIVHNRMSTDQSLLVNRRTWMLIPAGQSRQTEVPVGTLTTELVGQESAKNWTVGAPGYTQEINIEPARNVVANRPVISQSPVYAERPVYVDPPVYYSAPIIYLP